MRPLRLELEGFTAYRERTCLDLSDLDLFAITGPTGSGKSSLIDAMAYALYGRVPRVANRVEACIAQGLERMWVRLDFQVGGERYRIFRETRRRGPANIRMERGLDGQSEALEDRAKGVQERVEKLLGLDFDGFTRSVLLPQGQFQEFLAGAPEKRREVLRGLLRLDVYERVRARASEIERGLQREISGTEQRLREDYADATPENVHAMEKEKAAAEKQATTVNDEIAALEAGVTLAANLASARRQFAEAQAQLRQAERQIEDAARLLEEGSARIDDAKARLGETASQLGANPFEPGLYARLTGAAKVAEQLDETLRDLTKAIDALTAREKEEAAARGGEANAKELLGRCQQARQEAEEELRQAQRHNAAALVQEALAPGEQCPVCGGVVGTLPVIVCPDLDRARAAFENARRDEEGARQTVSRAQSDVARVEALRKAVQGQIQELEKRQARLEAQLAQELPEGHERSTEAIGQALKEQEGARIEREELERQEGEARAALEGLQRALEKARVDAAQLQAEADAAKKTLEEATSGGRSAVGLLLALATARGWADIGDKAPSEDVGGILKTRLEEARTRLGQLREDIGRMDQQIQHLQEQIEKRKALEENLKGVRARHDVAADLAQMLRADRFQAFVQSEALRLLAEEGSLRLEKLSGGRYRLAVAANGQDFEVVDQWNADDTRSVRTLSGGETFLASLGLALALAEALPGLAAGRNVALDSIFLDEGFGSLDSEALDRAADALDSLRAANRMVCVITHLKELAERLPARVVVHKSEAGSTVEVV